MPKPGLPVQIEFIKKHLREGGKRIDILAKYVKKWPTVSERTFSRRLKEAQDELQDEKQAIKDKTAELVAKEVKARKLDIMDAMERKAILTKMARGKIYLYKPIVVKNEIQLVKAVPDYNDRKSAIAELNRMDGDYAPAKISQTNPDGTEIEQKTTMSLSDALALLAELKK